MRSSLSLVVAGTVIALAGAYAAPTGATSRHEDFTAELSPVNSGGSGHVELHQSGTHLDVDLSAIGLDDGIHVAHIHGIKQAEAECPALSRDLDGNGLVDIGEGLPDYGPVVRTLSSGLNDRGTTLAYERSFTHLDNGDGIASLGPLDGYSIVVHGVDVDEDGMATNPDALGNGPGNADNEISMPALCGVIVLD